MLDALSGLGNGFDVAACGETTLLIRRRYRHRPALRPCQTSSCRRVKRPSPFWASTRRRMSFTKNEFKALGVQTVIATADGSCGTRGFVTDALLEQLRHRLRLRADADAQGALSQKRTSPASISLEARMGCGFGACMGCTIDTVNGPKRVCREGPVFGREEMLMVTTSVTLCGSCARQPHHSRERHIWLRV